MIGLMALTVAAVWLLLSVLMTVACAAIGRAGYREDEVRGYLPDALPARSSSRPTPLRIQREVVAR